MAWEINGVGASSGQLASMRADLGVDGKKALWIPAGAMLPTISNGCTGLATTEVASGQPDITYLSFSNATTQYATFSIVMPSSWNEDTVTFKPHWTHPAADTGSVIWELRGLSLSDTNSIATNWSGATAQTSTDNGSATANIFRTGPESSAITISGSPAAGDIVFFRLGRDTSDTMAYAAYLLGITLFYTTNEGVDA